MRVVKTCLIGFSLFLVFETALLAKPKITVGADLGLQVMGSIIDHTSGHNIALIKVLATNRVEAIRRGSITVKHLYVKQVHQKYIRVSHIKTKAEYLIYQDKFLGQAQEEGNQQESSITFAEEGLEVRDHQILMTTGYRDSLLNEKLNEILLQVTAVPFYEDGRLSGFRLIQINRDSLFHNFGFKNNDIIYAINGRSLTSLADTLKILDGIKKESNIIVKFMRNDNSLAKLIAVQ